jgi:hypothetical protein
MGLGKSDDRRRQELTWAAEPHGGQSARRRADWAYCAHRAFSPFVIESAQPGAPRAGAHFRGSECVGFSALKALIFSALALALAFALASAFATVAKLRVVIVVALMCDALSSLMAWLVTPAFPCQPALDVSATAPAT